MGWWESFTDALGFTNHAEKAAANDYANELRAISSATAEEIAKGRSALQGYYDDALSRLRVGYGGATDMLRSGADQSNAVLQQAEGTISDYLNQGRNIAEGYYKPYGRAINVLTGVEQGTPAETARLVEGSPLYKWQQEQAQRALDRNMRAKGLGSSRFAAKAQMDATAELAAKEQERRLNQLMQLYQNSGQLGQQMGQNYMTAGTNIGNLQQTRAANISQNSVNAANLGFDYGKLQSGSLQDLGSSVAASYGAIGQAKSDAYSAAAQAQAQAKAFTPNVLENAMNIFKAGSGTWW